MTPREEHTRPLESDPLESRTNAENDETFQAMFYTFTNKLREMKDPQAVLVETLKTICDACDLPKASVSLRMPESGQSNEPVE